MLGLRFCARAFSNCGKWGPLFIAVRGPLTIAASLVAEHRLQTRRLSICGARAQSLHGMWDLPRPGLEPVCPAPAGRLPTTAPRGKPQHYFLSLFCQGNIVSFLVGKRLILMYAEWLKKGSFKIYVKYDFMKDFNLYKGQIFTHIIPNI